MKILVLLALALTTYLNLTTLPTQDYINNNPWKRTVVR
jgi:hypothetical protein